MNHSDSSYMHRCVELAKLGASLVAPNPMVGAVLVHNDRIIGEGYHKQYGESHAEVNCIQSVSKTDIPFISDSTLYVSLEPCSHFGKTPPCTDLILKHHIKKVVIGSQDFANHVNGKGIQKLRSHGVEVIQDVGEKEAMFLNRRFFTFHQKKRPYIILKWAESKDGFIGKKNERTPLSNTITNKLVHQWRSEEAAIWVGYNTAITDNPSLTVRHATGKNPVRVIFDRQLNLPHSLTIFNHEAQSFIYNLVESKVENANQFIKVNADTFVQDILHHLFQMNILSILVEGGSKLHNQLLELNLWDEIRRIETPTLLHSGVKAAQAPSSAVISEQYNLAQDLITIYHRPYSL